MNKLEKKKKGKRIRLEKEVEVRGPWEKNGDIGDFPDDRYCFPRSTVWGKKTYEIVTLEWEILSLQKKRNTTFEVPDHEIKVKAISLVEHLFKEMFYC